MVKQLYLTKRFDSIRYYHSSLSGLGSNSKKRATPHSPKFKD